LLGPVGVFCPPLQSFMNLPRAGGPCFCLFCLFSLFSEANLPSPVFCFLARFRCVISVRLISYSLGGGGLAARAPLLFFLPLSPGAGPGFGLAPVVPSPLCPLPPPFFPFFPRPRAFPLFVLFLGCGRWGGAPFLPSGSLPCAAPPPRRALSPLSSPFLFCRVSAVLSSGEREAFIVASRADRNGGSCPWIPVWGEGHHRNQVCCPSGSGWFHLSPPSSHNAAETPLA